MTIAIHARRAALDAFALGADALVGESFHMRTSEPSQYLSGQRLRLAREALAILRSRPNDCLDVAGLAAAVTPRIVELIGSGAVRL